MRYVVVTFLLLMVSGSAQRPWPNTWGVRKEVCDMRCGKAQYGANEWVKSRKGDCAEVCRNTIVCCEGGK